MLMSSISHLKGPEIFWLCKAGGWGTEPSSEVLELSHILGNADTARRTDKHCLGTSHSNSRMSWTCLLKSGHFFLRSYW